MRKAVFFSTIGGAAIALGAWFAVAIHADDTFQMGISELPSYDISVERTLTGTVASMAHPDESRLMNLRMMFFRLMSGDKSLTVLLGPREFIERTGFTLNAGATVTIVGAPALVDGKQILLAREVSGAGGGSGIRGNDEKLVVRDERGEPKWVMPDDRIPADPRK